MFYFQPYIGEMIQIDDCAYFFKWVETQPPGSREGINVNHYFEHLKSPSYTWKPG